VAAVKTEVAGHLASLVPRDRQHEFQRQRRDRQAHCDSAVIPWQVEEEHEPGLPLDEGPPALVPFLPMMRSPSQWPGIARSSASAGRSLMLTMFATDPVRLTAPCALRVARPDRSHRASSWRNSPLPCT
jgi:hypothetical protein